MWYYGRGAIDFTSMAAIVTAAEQAAELGTDPKRLADGYGPSVSVGTR